MIQKQQKLQNHNVETAENGGKRVLCAAEFNLNFAIQARSVFLSSNAEMKS
jgi:hypothetical protein